MNTDQALEYACLETFTRHKQAGVDGGLNSFNIEYAIAHAIADNNFTSFTRNNGARDIAGQLTQDDMISTLLTNMVYLSDNQHKTNETLGNIDSDIKVVSSYLQDPNFRTSGYSEVKNMIVGGSYMLAREMEELSAIKDLNLRKQREEELAALRYNNNPYYQRMYELAKSLMVAYTEYSIAYRKVTTSYQVTNFYDQRSLDNLRNSPLCSNRTLGNEGIPR